MLLATWIQQRIKKGRTDIKALLNTYYSRLNSELAHDIVNVKLESTTVSDFAHTSIYHPIRSKVCNGAVETTALSL